MKGLLAFISALGIIPGALWADHGQSLFIVQDTEVPAPWSGHLWSNASWEKYDSHDELSIEPGFALGLTSWVALGVSGRFADEGDGWKYSSLSPHLQIRLTPSDWPIRVGVLAGYSWGENEEPISNHAYEEVIVTTGSQQKTHSSVKRSPATATSAPSTSPVEAPAEEPVPCGPAYGPDAPPCSEVSAAPKKTVNSSHRQVMPRHGGHRDQQEEPPVTTPASSNQSAPSSANAEKKSTKTTSQTRTKTIRREHHQENRENGIHVHGREHFFARLMIEGDVTERDTVFFNLINVVPRHGQTAWGYALGYRHTFSSAWAAGVEATGDFGSADEHRGLLGVYWRPHHHFLLKLGGGVGFSRESAEVTAQTGLVWSF
jgi:hypothetical protein